MSNFKRSLGLFLIAVALSFVVSKIVAQAHGTGPQCAPETFTCGDGWQVIAEITVICCSDNNWDNSWHECQVTTDEMQNSDPQWQGYICWKMVSKGSEGTDECQPMAPASNLQYVLGPCCSLRTKL